MQDRARLATQALPRFEGPGIGDVPVGLVVELEASAPVLGLQDTGTDRNRVLCKPSGASRPTIRAEQKSGHITFSHAIVVDAYNTSDDSVLFDDPLASYGGAQKFWDHLGSFRQAYLLQSVDGDAPGTVSAK